MKNGPSVCWGRTTQTGTRPVPWATARRLSSATPESPTSATASRRVMR